MKINQAITKSILLLVAAVIFLMLPGLKLPYIDKNTDTYFSASMTKAGAAYGVCRAVNAAVSAIKESQIQIEPAGLGVSLAVGQVLDPLDDMTERASDILVTAIVSLGLQKIAYELCVAFVPSLIGFSIIVLFGISFVKGDRATTLRGLVVSSIILLFVARLSLPISSIINAYLQDNYFSPQIVQVQDELEMHSPELERLRDVSMPKVDGVLGTVKNGFDFVGKRTSDLGATLKAMIGNMESMISNLLKLTYLYVAVFIVQVIILPVGTFWILIRITNALLGTGFPYIFNNSDVVSKMNKKDKV